MTRLLVTKQINLDIYYAHKYINKDKLKGVRWRGNVGGITGLRYDTTMTDVRVYKL